MSILQVDWLDYLIIAHVNEKINPLDKFCLLCYNYSMSFIFQSYFQLILIVFVIYGLTLFGLYHPLSEFVKGLILNFCKIRQVDIFYSTWYNLLERGFSCFYCQSFWISIIICIIFQTGFWEWLGIWGCTSFLYGFKNSGNDL
jgi:hypothetical protein